MGPHRHPEVAAMSGDELVALRDAKLELAESRQRFERAIVAALAAGHSTRVVGEAAGMTHARVAQIENSRRGKST